MKKQHYSYKDSVSLLSRPVVFVPVTDNGDEVAEEIIQDQDAHDNRWELSDMPDGDRLAAFWDQVAREWDTDETAIS